MWNYLYLGREFNTPSMGVVLCTTRRFCYRVLVILVQIIESNMTMVGWRMMLGEIVCLVGFSRGPVYDEMALFYSVVDPVEAHINCL